MPSLALLFGLVSPAQAAVCEDELYRRIESIPEHTQAPIVSAAHIRYKDHSLAGGRVTMRSASPVSAWRFVLEHPEQQVSWLPEQFGVTRTERLDPTHIFEQLELSFVFGAIKARRQLLIAYDWRWVGATFESCWSLGPGDAFAAVVNQWATEDPWQTVGMGNWLVEPQQDGGSNVSYQLWTKSDLLPAVQAWALSRTLPDLMRAFDARVQAVAAGL